MLLLYVILTGA